MTTLEVEPPRDFAARILRAADCWRALDPEDADVCLTAAWICDSVGAHDLAWDYLTTPLARPLPDEQPLWQLAVGLQNAGARRLADRAFAVASEADPTNPLTLWLRAENLQDMGRVKAARHLFRQIADGDWPPGWELVQEQARERLEGR